MPKPSQVSGLSHHCICRFPGLLLAGTKQQYLRRHVAGSMLVDVEPGSWTEGLSYRFSWGPGRMNRVWDLTSLLDF